VISRTPQSSIVRNIVLDNLLTLGGELLGPAMTAGGSSDAG
jgi:hypothetical protein